MAVPDGDGFALRASGDAESNHQWAQPPLSSPPVYRPSAAPEAAEATGVGVAPGAEVVHAAAAFTAAPAALVPQGSSWSLRRGVLLQRVHGRLQRLLSLSPQLASFSQSEMTWPIRLLFCCPSTTVHFTGSVL